MTEPAAAQRATGRPDVSLFELRGITKRYGHLLANDAINLSLWPSEVHGLLGENGAGKTTLMRILYGLTAPDAGEIRVNGQPIRVRSPADAISAGIGMVSQHFSLVAPMTVTENVILGRTAGVRVDMRAARERVASSAERFGIRLDPDVRVESLSLGEQQRVEILKALYHDCRVLILDEPTAVLVPQEVGQLLETLRRLVADGLSVVFISHKLHEVLSITDEVTVLRHGRVEGNVRTADTDARQLAAMMVGRPTFGVTAERGGRLGRPILRVDGVSATGARGLPALHDVSFEVAEGEILGVAGVSGNGQTELAELLSGMRAPTAGSVTVDGREIAGRSPQQVMAAGVGRIPEDRRASVVPDMSVAYNLALEHLDDFRRGTVLDERRLGAHAEELIERYAIKARPRDRIGGLSGGNMQKVLLARVLSREPRAIVVAQPTRGLDIGATEYVRTELLRQRQRGAAILLVSEDLDELLELADRLIVLFEGRLMGEVTASEADPGRLGMLMAGRGAPPPGGPGASKVAE